MASDRNYEYEVALSFAGEDRPYASQLANILRRRGVRFFFDEYEKHTLWGKNLYTHLSEVYQSQARYCVVFISKHYAMKLWTNHEREAAQARAFLENEEYILPIRLDETQLPGIPSTISYLSWPPETAKTIADVIVKKLGKVSSRETREAKVGNSNSVEKYYTEMLHAYEQAIQLDASNPYSYVLKGEALSNLERYEQALEAYHQALKLDPSNKFLYIHIGNTLDELERYEEALLAYDRFLENTPDDAYVLGCKSFDLQNLDRYEEALEACELSLQLAANDAVMQGQKGILCYMLDDLEEALGAYEQSLKLDPTSDWIFCCKGDVLYDLERYEDALEAYEKAIQLDPRYSSAYKGKGNALYELKHYKEALAAYNRAIQINPKDADTFIRKGDTLKLILESRKNAKKPNGKPIL
ncbi:MAG: tetratricopeptide repeat protein [Ktedonobacteraceae bacterium]